MIGFLFNRTRMTEKYQISFLTIVSFIGDLLMFSWGVSDSV